MSTAAPRMSTMRKSRPRFSRPRTEAPSRIDRPATAQGQKSPESVTCQASGIAAADAPGLPWETVARALDTRSEGIRTWSWDRVTAGSSHVLPPGDSCLVGAHPSHGLRLRLSAKRRPNGEPWPLPRASEDHFPLFGRCTGTNGRGALAYCGLPAAVRCPALGQDQRSCCWQ